MVQAGDSNSGLSLSNVVRGGNQQKASLGQEVAIAYQLARKVDPQTMIASAGADAPFKFILGANSVIRGFEMAVSQLCVGDKATAHVHSDLAYGKVGQPPEILDDEDLIIHLEVLAARDADSASIPIMNDEQKIQRAEETKERANTAFRDKKYDEALVLFKEASSFVSKLSQYTEYTQEIRKLILQNVALTQTKTGDYQEALTNSTAALQINITSAKALYLRSLANMHLKNYSEAFADCRQAIQLKPSDKALRQHYEALRNLAQQAQSSDSERERKAISKLFQNSLYSDRDPEANKRMPDFDIAHIQVFMDIQIGTEGQEGYQKGRIVMELFKELVPRTVENFRALCTGELGMNLHYKTRVFQRIIPGFMMQGGKIVVDNNGTEAQSIYGTKFADEQVWIPHTHEGILSMANAGPDTNGSSFFVIYGPTPHLDGKHTVFGRVVHGYNICKVAEAIPQQARDSPSLPVVIVNAGELSQSEKMTAEQCGWLHTYSQ